MYRLLSLMAVIGKIILNGKGESLMPEYKTNQKQLAAALGITMQHLSNVKHGKSGISDELALSLEGITGIKRTIWMATTRKKTLQRELDNFFEREKQREILDKENL